MPVGGGVELTVIHQLVMRFCHYENYNPISQEEVFIVVQCYVILCTFFHVQYKRLTFVQIIR